MKRRQFLTYTALAGGSGLFLSGASPLPHMRGKSFETAESGQKSADIIIIGGGLGGCAAAIAACRNGLKAILVEETDWIGGQLSQQGVPPDEHQWIETHGAPASYRVFRRKVREYYKRNYPMTEEALGRENLNPGDGAVSRLCHEPMAGEAVMTEMLMPYVSMGWLEILLNYKAAKADVDGDEVKAVEIRSELYGRSIILEAPYFVDATECGDLLPLTKTEYVTGTESRAQTGELHAAEKADPTNNQAFTVCFAMDYLAGEDLTIDKPKNYPFWRDYVPALTPAWPGRLLDLSYSKPDTLEKMTLGFDPNGEPTGNVMNWFNYRKIINRRNFAPGSYKGDVTIVNWPQNDYLLGNIIDAPEGGFDKHVEAAKELNLSLFYWLQTEAPRPDGGTGWPGLRLRGDIMGTADGMAKYPYIREARRIKAEFTILEEHVGAENRRLVSGENAAADFYDSVGVGFYNIDLHPTCNGNNYIDVPSFPFQIPLGALLPQRVDNLLPACKNIGSTHITNGCYRLHPVEWSIGEAVGLLVAYSEKKKIPPRAVRGKGFLPDFQKWIAGQGIETKWAPEAALLPPQEPKGGDGSIC